QDPLGTAGDVQFHRAIEDQAALVGIEESAHRTAAALGNGEFHPFGSRRDSALLVEGQAAGLDVNLALGSALRSAADWGRLRRAPGNGFGRHCGCFAWPHERNLYRPGCLGDPLLLVVLKFIPGDAVHAGAVFAVELDLDVVENGATALFQLDDLGGVNLE